MEPTDNKAPASSPHPDDAGLFRHTVDAIAAAVFVFQGPSLIYVNPAAAAITGYTKDELLRMDFWRIIHPDFQTLVKERGMARQRGETVPTRYDVKIVRKDGETRWVDFCAGTVELAGHQAVVGSAYDITDRKTAEAELQKTNEEMERRVRERTATLSTANRLMLAEAEQRQRAELELRASRELFERFMLYSPSAAYIKDGDGRYLFVNAQFERLLKRPKSDWIGKTDFDVWPEATARRFRSIDEAVLSEGRPQENLSVIEQEDGRRYWLNVKFPVEHGGGQRLIGGVAVDITDLRRAEEQLRRTSFELEAIFQAIPDLCFRFSADGTILDYKGGDPEGLYGSPGEFLGRRVEQVLPPAAGRLYSESIARVCQTGVSVTLEYTLPLTGGERTFESRLMPFAESGAFAVVRDITQRRMAELELRRQALVFENMQDAVILTDPQGRIIDWSPGSERMFGYRRDEVIGRTPEFLQKSTTIVPSTAEIVDTVSQVGRWAGEVDFVDKSGGTRTCETVVVPLRDADGTIIGTIGLNHDITDRLRTARELQDAKEAAEAASLAKSAFLANISHEIRTPITAMLGAAELLFDGDATKSPPKDQVEMVLRNGRHLLALIDDLLDLSRAEAARLQVKRTACSFSEILADVQAVTRPLLRRRTVDFRIIYETPFPDTILTDPTRLKQAIINLVDNALKFTHSGRVWIRIAFAEVAARPQLVIAVEDTGPGIAAGDTDRIFETFTQLGTDALQTARGAGLGLPLAKWIAEQLGGRLEIESELDRGSVFTLRVPTGPTNHAEWIAPGDGPVTAYPDRAGALRGPQIRFQGSVLIAEDFVDTRIIMETALTRRGVNVTAVDNGEAAVERALAETFDLILMDIRMPKLDGLQATLELRRKGYLAPIVALTASFATDDERRLREAGFDDRWDKPLTLDALIANVAGYLRTGEHGNSPDQRPSRVPTDLTAAVIAFVETLPARFSALKNAVNSGDSPSAHTMLHQLVGAGGIHGFMELSVEAARLLELAHNGTLAGRPEQLAALQQLIGAIATA